MLSLFWKITVLLNCRSNVCIQQFAHQNCCSMVSVVVSTLEYDPEGPGSNLGQHTKIFQYFFLLFGYFRLYGYFFPLNWFFFLNIYRKKIIKKRCVLLIVKCFEHIFEPSPNVLAGGRVVTAEPYIMRLHTVFGLYLACIKVRLHTAISRVDFVPWWMI